MSRSASESRVTSSGPHRKVTTDWVQPDHQLLLRDTVQLMRLLPSFVRNLQFGRWLVIVAGAIGLFFLLFQLAVGDHSLYGSFLEGAVASLATMVLGGTGQRYWGRAKLEEVSGPGGWGMKFAKATRRSLRVAVDGLLDQMDAVNARLLSLEEDVAALKGDPPAQESDPQTRS